MGIRDTMGSDDGFVEVPMHHDLTRTPALPVETSAPKAPQHPKGSCVIVHRGREILMENSPGKRIVSVKFDVSRTDKDPLGTAYSKLVNEFEKGGAPAIYEVDLLAKWYDPKDSTVKVRLRIPHARYASWKDHSYTSIASTRERQTIDDRIDITFDDKLPMNAVTKAKSRAVTATPVVAVVPDASSRPRRPDYRRQAVITLMSAAAIYAFMSLGGIFMALSGVPIAFLIVHTCFFYDEVRKQRRGIESIAANSTPIEARTLPARSEEWDLVRTAISDHAGQRADDVARAEMRIRGLLESPAPSLNPIVIESCARIGNGLRDLVAAHRAPASMATPQEAAVLADRLADSICALGVEAEDARVVAFRDAVFDFDAATRYIESRNDPILRIAGDPSKPEA